MGIDTVTGHNDDVTDFVEKTQRAMHAEVERGNDLAEENVRLREKLETAAEAHPGCGLLDDAASECQCAQRERHMRAELAAEKSANAELHDASEERHTRLRIANAHLSRLAAIVRTYCEEGKLHGFAAGTGTGLALKLALEHSTDDFVPRKDLEAVQTHCNDVTAKLHRQLDELRAKLAAAEQQAAAALRERDAMRAERDAACRERAGLLAQLDARNAPVPGLSSLPYYTPDDAKLIQAARPGVDRSRLLVTAKMADALVTLRDSLKRKP